MSYLKNSTLRNRKTRPITAKELRRLREFHDTVRLLQDEQFTGDQHSVRKYEYKKSVIKLTDPQPNDSLY